jgi:hypothetical protein
MKRVICVSLMVVVLCLAVSSCAGKLTTIRPTLISRIGVKNCETDETVEHLRGEQQDLDWLMDDLVFQMEQFYLKDGKCAETDEHLYDVAFYMNDRLELSVFINSDGSVCRNGSRYVQRDREDNGAVHPVDLTQWKDFFDFSEE